MLFWLNILGFNSTEQDIREYQASEFAEYFGMFILMEFILKIVL